MNFIGKAVNKCFGVIFAFTILFSAIEWTKGMAGSRTVNGLLIIPVMLGALGIYMGIGKLEPLIKKRLGNNESAYKRTFVLLVLGLLAVQILFAVFSDFAPINDLSHVSRAAENYVRYGISRLYEGLPVRHQKYFSVYPNNHMLFMIIALCYKVTLAVTGGINNFLPMALNVLALNLSYVFMCKSARLVYSPEKALTCTVRGLLFIPLITYAPFFYTDSLCMPFISAAVWLYIKLNRRSDKDKRAILLRYFSLLGCAVLLAVGYTIKGSAIIMLIAMALDIVIRRKGLADKAASIGVMMAGFAAVSAAIGALGTSVLNISEEELYKNEFPKMHWIMMSADGQGGYDVEDFFYTKGVKGYDNKKAADMERFIEKVQQQGAAGFAWHLYQKLTYTWRDGTYMSGYYHGDNKFLNSAFFKVLAAALHFALMTLTLKGYLSRVKAEGDEMTDAFFLKICHMGLLAFLLIWEARCRYLVSFFLLFALI